MKSKSNHLAVKSKILRTLTAIFTKVQTAARWLSELLFGLDFQETYSWIWRVHGLC